VLRLGVPVDPLLKDFGYRCCSFAPLPASPRFRGEVAQHVRLGGSNSLIASVFRHPPPKPAGH